MLVHSVHKNIVKISNKADILKRYFTKQEKLLWIVSVISIILSFLIFDRENYMTLAASIIGVTSLILNAKGNPFGQFLIIIFSILYGVISYKFSYYGEMITYIGMTAPMAFVALVFWLKNPYNGKRTEVAVNCISVREALIMCVLAFGVTVLFYFVLKYFNTANLLPSTVSVTTSFMAAYLTFRRSPYFALLYATNDIVLIILWVLAAFENITYVSVVVCFFAFLINDLYGFISWKSMEKRQLSEKTVEAVYN